ncbi:MAG: hypothetical protein CUN54_10490, partial [Phototrophicales bacterium]
HRGTSMLMASLHPEMTIALVRRNRRRVTKLQTIAVTTDIVAAIIFIPIVASYGPTVIDLWTRQEFGASHLFVAACAIEAVAFGSQAVFGLVPWASNSVRLLSVFYVLGSMIAMLVGAFGAVIF